MSQFFTTPLSGRENLEDLIVMVGSLQEQLAFILDRNLDTRNIRELGNWLVQPDSFKSRDGTVGISSLVTGGDDVRFFAGNANMASAPFRVYESGRLVATQAEITGLITASDIEGGTITGARVQTRVPGMYPRVELNETLNSLVAEASANDRIGFDLSFYAFPTIFFESAGIRSFIHAVGDILAIIGAAEIRLDPFTGPVSVPSWARFENSLSGQNLQQALDAKANNFVGQFTSVVTSGGTMHFTNGVLTAVT